jgi:enoyl-CoA hydratase
MSQSNFQNITLAFEGTVAVLTLNRPKALNALNSDTIEEMGQAIAQVKASDARALILTGAGKAFVAGADISQMSNLTPTQAEHFARRGQEVFASLEALAIPVIAAVNGFALGGGCELALACDIIYASEKARFGQPEVNLGVIPGFGGTQRLTRLVGRGVAAELILSGRMIKADEAVRVGLAVRAFPPEELMGEAMKLAQEIASKGPLAVASAKRLLHQGADIALDRANSMEASAFAACFATEDQREGMTAFLKKRPANFKGQ